MAARLRARSRPTACCASASPCAASRHRPSPDLKAGAAPHRRGGAKPAELRPRRDPDDAARGPRAAPPGPPRAPRAGAAGTRLSNSDPVEIPMIGVTAGGKPLMYDAAMALAPKWSDLRQAGARLGAARQPRGPPPAAA